MKYPGSQILYEVGTRKELAESYGVSERTIYRWINKAAKESGIKIQKPRRPRLSTLENFSGTRAQLAKKYGVSERTVYRWLDAAKSKGANIPSRAQKSKYPGSLILGAEGTRRQLAQSFGVSTSTIDRWRKKAKEEISKGLPEEVITPDMLPEEIITPDMLPQEIFTDDQLPQEVFTPDQLPEEIVFDEEDTGETDKGEFTDQYKQDIQDLTNMLQEYDQLNADSLFWDIPADEKLKYLDAYIMYQDDQNHTMFYDPEIHDFNYSPDFVSTINIWGDEFESWLRREKGLEDFGADWLDEL